MNQIGDALVNLLLAAIAGAVVVLPIAWGLARSKIAKAAAIAEAEALEAQNRLAEAKKLNAALVLHVEDTTAQMPKAEAKRTKEAFAAAAEEMGAGSILKATVEGLGLSSASRAEIRSPSA